MQAQVNRRQTLLVGLLDGFAIVDQRAYLEHLRTALDPVSQGTHRLVGGVCRQCTQGAQVFADAL
ncbi:hypothetical protein D3C79_1055490 [compost metagenome]